MALQQLDAKARCKRLAELEAEALLRDPLTAHPYPTQACQERDRLASMSPEDRRRTVEKHDYDGGRLYLGRKEFRAWYTLVLQDLELYAQTIRELGPRRCPRLVRGLEMLATAYAVMPAPWPRDRAQADGAPCTSPQAYQRLARHWAHALRSVPAQRAQRPEQLEPERFGGPREHSAWWGDA